MQFTNLSGEMQTDHQREPTMQPKQDDVINTTPRDYNEHVIVYTAVVLMSTIIVVGSIGNTMVILAIQSSKKLQMIATNVFIVNLSVCDLLFVTVVLPFNIYTYVNDDWYLDQTLCKFIGFLGYTLTGTTLMNISLIAWNRYKLVTDLAGYKELFTGRNVSMMLVACWVLPVLCLLPALLGLWGQFEYVPVLVTCNLSLNHGSQSFKLFLLFIRVLIPCGMILYCYIIIHRISSNSHRKMTHAMSLSSIYTLRMHKQELHLTRMMCTIFLVFMLSYFPCTITSIIDWNTILSKHFHMYCEITVYIGSAVNPLVYGLMNSQFREAYLRLLNCRQESVWKCENDHSRVSYSIKPLGSSCDVRLNTFTPSQSDPILEDSEEYSSEETGTDNMAHVDAIVLQIHTSNRFIWEWIRSSSPHHYEAEKF